SRRVNPRRDPFIGRGQRLRTSDGPRANHPMELTESRAGARASVAHLESQAASQAGVVQCLHSLRFSWLFLFFRSQFMQRIKSGLDLLQEPVGSTSPWLRKWDS